MLKAIFLLAIATIAKFACAAVDVNTADQAALDGIRGVGPTMSKAILAERSQHGDFKSWADLQARVKGIGEKNSERFSEAGMTVNGVPKSVIKSHGKRNAAAVQ
jgi:competence protein ComEA